MSVRPKSKSLGHRSVPNGGSAPGLRPIGLWLRRFATSKKAVCCSPNVNMLSPTAKRRTLFASQINDSLHPFCQGASADLLNVNCKPFETPI